MASPDVLVAGETLVDFLPDRSGSLSAVEGFSRRAGGAPANVAVALARLDATPWFLTRLADDPFGEFLAETLAENGVPGRFVTRDPERPTALAFVTHDAAGDRSFTFYRDDTADVHLDDVVPDEALDAVSWVVVGGVMLAAEPGRSATFSLVERARDHDCTVVFDPNSRPELWTHEAERAAVLDWMFDLADVVKASADDVAGTEYAADDPAAVARNLTDAAPHTAFLTLGRAGSLAHATGDAPWNAGTVTHPGYDVDVVDTTGAGDAFTAGIVAALADGDDDLESALSFGNAVAAATTTDAGAIAALPDREQVEALREGGT